MPIVDIDTAPEIDVDTLWHFLREKGAASFGPSGDVHSCKTPSLCETCSVCARRLPETCHNGAFSPIRRGQDYDLCLTCFEAKSIDSSWNMDDNRVAMPTWKERGPSQEPGQCWRKPARRTSTERRSSLKSESSRSDTSSTHRSKSSSRHPRASFKEEGKGKDVPAKAGNHGRTEGCMAETKVELEKPKPASQTTRRQSVTHQNAGADLLGFRQLAELKATPSYISDSKLKELHSRHRARLQDCFYN